MLTGEMPKNQFDEKNTSGGFHECPINSKLNNQMYNHNGQDSVPKDSSDTGTLILNELKSLSSHMFDM